MYFLIWFVDILRIRNLLFSPFLEVLGIDPRTSHMVVKPSTTKFYLHPWISIFFFLVWEKIFIKFVQKMPSIIGYIMMFASTITNSIY